MTVKLFENQTAEFVNVTELPIDMIKPNPYQQRKYFDFYSLNKLTESIKRFGVLQPITVRVINGKSYELISGERRLRASKAAGLKTIPAVFIDADEEESSVLSFIENLQRKNIDFLEEAEGFKSFIDDFSMGIEEISLKTGISQSVIRRRLKILELSEEELRFIRDNKVDEQYIVSVLKIPDKEIRFTAIKDIIEQDMTVKKAEDYVEKILFCMRFGSHEQKVKSSFNDMKLFTNSIKQSVDQVRNAGIPAYYDIVETSDSFQITIKIINNTANEVEIACV